MTTTSAVSGSGSPPARAVTMAHLLAAADPPSHLRGRCKRLQASAAGAARARHRTAVPAGPRGDARHLDRIPPLHEDLVGNRLTPVSRFTRLRSIAIDCDPRRNEHADL